MPVRATLPSIDVFPPLVREPRIFWATIDPFAKNINELVAEELSRDEQNVDSVLAHVLAGYPLLYHQHVHREEPTHDEVFLQSALQNSPLPTPVGCDKLA